MSAIEHALQMVERAIPSIILEKAFPTQGFATHTLRDRIREQIVRDIVIPDADIVGGELTYLPVLDGIRTNYRRNELAVFYSDRYLAGREIMSVHAHYSTLGRASTGMPGIKSATGMGGGGNNTSSGCSPCASSNFCEDQNTTLKSAQQMAMNTLGEVGDPTNVNISLIAKNTILVKYNLAILGGAFKVVMSNDPYLNNIQPRSWMAFGELCVLATKSFVYNRTVISLGRTKMLEGIESTAMTQFIDRFSTAEEAYLLYLRGKWAKTSFMNDTDTWQSHIRSMHGFRT